MKRLMIIAVIAIIAVSVGWNFNQSKNEVVLTDLALANVEALARGEDPNDPNLAKGMKKVNCTKNGAITGTKCESAGPYDECHYRNDVTGKCD